jgi:uncharacterized membrane protein YccC
MTSSSPSRGKNRASITAAIGGLVAVLGSLGAVIAIGSSSPLWAGLLIGLAILLLLSMGIVIGLSRKNSGK